MRCTGGCAVTGSRRRSRSRRSRLTSRSVTLSRPPARRSRCSPTPRVADDRGPSLRSRFHVSLNHAWSRAVADPRARAAVPGPKWPGPPSAPSRTGRASRMCRESRAPRPGTRPAMRTGPRRGRPRPCIPTPSSHRDGPLPHGPREPGNILGARAGDVRAPASPVRRAGASCLPPLRRLRPWLRETSLRNVSARPARRVRWAPGALPALAGRFPGAPFRTGHAPFVMHPALHDGSRREAGGPKPAGRVRRESDR